MVTDATWATVDCVPGGGCLRADGISSSWWDGQAWGAPVSLPAGMMRTDPQLSCVSATACVLVTTDFGVEGWPTPGIVTSSTWNGTSWSPVVTLDHQTRALDLDCATATVCFATAGVRADYWTSIMPPGARRGAAVGRQRLDDPGRRLPGRGRAHRARDGVVRVGRPTAPWCRSPVGATRSSPTVLARWDGATWTGAVTDAAASIMSLSCAGATDCTAVGNGAAQRLEGDGWSDTELPTGRSPGEVLGAVSCAADDLCVAVGSGWTLRTPSEGPLLTPTVQRYDGDAWSADEAGDRQLSHVSCVAPTSCMAAGSELGRTWTLHFDGDAWSSLPDLTGLMVGGVSGLSCATDSWCLLTTTGYSGGGDQAWVWSGGSSWVATAALPAGTGTVGEVSCTAPGECVAVSDWIGPAVHRLAAGAWTPVPIDQLGLDWSAGFEDIACTAIDECIVVGYGRLHRRRTAAGTPRRARRRGSGARPCARGRR